MATLVPSSSAEHVATVKATAPRYFKKASDLTMRRRLWLAMLERYGVVEYNADSFSTTWDVEYSEPEVRSYGDAGDQTFAEHDALQQLTVNVRGYTTTDKLTKKQRLMNKGKSQIYNLYEKKSKNLLKAIRKKFHRELYIDGYATNNDDRLIGIESFMGTDGNTVVGDIVANPSDTYGGLSTALGAISGSWDSDLATSPNATIATDWPYGRGDVEYDFIAPKPFNYGSSSWSSGNTNWLDNCEDVLRTAGIVCATLTDDEDTPMVHMLDSKMYADFCTYWSARGRIIHPHKESEDLGFGRTLNFEGAMVHFEYDCPPGVGYGLSPTMMELFSMEDTLFVPDGPSWSIEKKAWLYEVGFFGNLRFQPKYFAKYANYASA